MDAKEFTELFLRFEYENKMFKSRISNIHIWHYIRNNIYYTLLRMLDMSDALTNASRKSSKSRMTFQKAIRQFILCNQFLVHKRDVLIIPHERKYKDGDKYYKCIFTDLLDQNLVNSHYILDKKSMENDYAIQKSHNIIYLDLEAYKRIKNIKILHKTISKLEMDEVIFEPIEKYFNITFDLESKKRLLETVTYYINERSYLVRYYTYMLQKIQPKVVIMVVSYSFDRMILCEVASRKKIPVIELQHGVMNNTHIAYNFYKKVKLPSFPDYIFTFGQYERENIKFPIERNRIIPTGYPELEKNFRQYNKKKNDKKNILFISEGEVKITEYVVFAAKNLDAERYHIVLQLHPKEYYSWEERMGECLSHSNIEVVGSFEHTVHESLAQADWVIGNCSTVLYEAQMFDTKVIVLKFDFRYAEELCRNGYALLVDNPKQLVSEIEKDSFTPNKKISVFTENSLEKMQNSINSIISMHQKIEKRI